MTNTLFPLLFFGLGWLVRLQMWPNSSMHLKPYLMFKEKELSAAEDSTVGDEDDEDEDSSSTARLFWPCKQQ